MSDVDSFCVLLLRVTLAVVFLAHGYNHVLGGGRIAGTAGWFESLGMRPGRLHAWSATLTELGGGVLIGLGLVTPLAAGALLGVMLVALVTTHLRNGFFIFRPGEGYEYVLVLGLVALAVGGVGGGRFSLDHVLDILGGGWWQLVVTAALGLGGGAGQLAAFWRPQRRPAGIGSVESVG